MRTLVAVLICIVLVPTATDPERTGPPTVSAVIVTLGEVRRASEMSIVTELADSRSTLLVERPVGVSERTTSSVFVLAEGGRLLRRVPVEYGRASASLMQIVSGVSAGDRIVVSDMRAWDAFERLRLGQRSCRTILPFGTLMAESPGGLAFYRKEGRPWPFNPNLPTTRSCRPAR